MSDPGKRAGVALLDAGQAMATYLDALLSVAGTEDIGSVAGSAVPQPTPSAPAHKGHREYPPITGREEPESAAREETAAQDTYRIILVGGMRLGLPAREVTCVEDFQDEQLETASAGPAWVLGWIRIENSRVTVIDTWQMVSGRAAARDATPHILVLLQGGFGLLCEEVLDLVTPDPQGLRWRGAAGSRLWLAATSMESRCGILDTKGIKLMIEKE